MLGDPDGSLRSDLWIDREWPGQQGCQTQVSEGVLRLEIGSPVSQGGCAFRARRPEKIGLDKPAGIGMQVTTPLDGIGDYSIMLRLGTEEAAGDWSADCGAFVVGDSSRIRFLVADNRETAGADPLLYQASWLIVTCETYAIEIRADPVSISISCLVDGTIIGAYAAGPDADLPTAEYHRELLASWISGSVAHVQIDQVRLSLP